jgi:S1-C subfamily serine protease
MAVFPLLGNAQSNFPPFENLRKRNVALKMTGYVFSSGVDEQGNITTCKGFEVRPIQWWGSGFIVRADGTIVTNYHVAGKALEGDAKFDDGSTYRITQIKVYDPIHDLAILKIVANKQFPTVTLGNSDAVRPMDNVLAVGNPHGTGINVTDGRISQLVRDDNNNIMTLRHTAPITGGNSGGALYKGKEVVGVNVATWPGTQFHQAVPIRFVRPLMETTYDQPLSLRDVFLPTPETISQKARQIAAQNGTVPAATAQDKPGIVTIPSDFYPLEDILFVLQAEQGRNLMVIISDSGGRILGCDKGTGTNTNLLIVSTPYVPQQVGINILNYGNSPVNFGLSVLKVIW